MKAGKRAACLPSLLCCMEKLRFFVILDKKDGATC
jgi:hypothetical protein